MEFERSLFRIYERMMSSENFQLWTKILSITFFTLSWISLACLIYFHQTYINTSEILSKAFSEQLLNGSSRYSSEHLNLTLDLQANIDKYSNITLMPEDIYNISIGSVKFQFSLHFQVLKMPKDIKSRLNFTEHQIQLSYKDVVPTFMWPFVIVFNELDTIIINQVARIFRNNPGFIINTGSKEIWAWSKHQYEVTSNPSFPQKIGNLFSSVFVFIILSLVTGLICRLAIAGSAGVMISLSWCMSLFNATENTRMILFYSFPWAGQPAYSLRNAGKGIGSLVLSFFFMLFTFYFMYACTYLLWTPMIFGNIYPSGLDERLYTIFSIMEFYALLFVRTKKTIMWFPRIVMGLICTFILYRKNNFYPFMNTYFFGVTMLCFGTMVVMLSLFEKETFTHEGPTFESPRLVYQPVFTRNNSSLPEIWTLFYPVAGRGYFTEQQMSNIFPRQGPL